MPERRFLRTADVAALLGVKPETISVYRTRSRAGGAYAGHPFPEPDEVIGSAPLWFLERADEIKKWGADRRGPGRPSKTIAADID